MIPKPGLDDNPSSIQSSISGAELREVLDLAECIRTGAHYRAVGKFSQNVFIWEWIGTHEEYNKRF